MLRSIATALAVTAMSFPAMAQEWPAGDPRSKIDMASLTASQREACTSKWGPDDEIGNANHLSPELALNAARLVKTGKVYSLGIETNKKTPAFGGRYFNVLIHETNQLGIDGVGPTQGSYLDDVYIGYVGVGSQLDGLSHLGIGNTYYNCHQVKDFARSDGVTKLGIEKVPNIVTRGVLIDMAAFFGKPVVDAGTEFNRKEIEAQAKKQGIEIRRGDVVLFNTGWNSLIGTDDARYASGEPGLGVDGAKYLAEKGIVAVGADNFGVDVVPLPSGNFAEVHQTLITKNGIYVLENMHTAALAADKAYEFMFVLGPIKITGGVQSFVNPTAIR